MSINAKQIAQKMGISEAAVSMALNGKPGVSKKRRDEIIAVAKQYGYDFSRINERFTGGEVKFLIFTKNNAVVDNTQFFNLLLKHVEIACKQRGLRLSTLYFHNSDDLVASVNIISKTIQTGILLLATEMSEAELLKLNKINVPIVIMDALYDSIPFNYVCINNRQGAFLATDFLLRQFHAQPGYLQSSYSIVNFQERANGFYNAIRSVGLSSSQSIVHRLTPSLDGAYADMKQIIENGDKIARCYFADNDLIALGAIKAFREKGYKIPRDIAIIGFDNIPACNQSTPSLSSIDVPKNKLGECAIEVLLSQMRQQVNCSLNIIINTSLIMRASTDF